MGYIVFAVVCFVGVYYANRTESFASRELRHRGQEDDYESRQLSKTVNRAPVVLVILLMAGIAALLIGLEETGILR